MSGPPILLDTCAMLWVGEDQPISDEARIALDEAWRSRQPVFVSPITAWEIGLLTSRGRLALTLPPHAWFADILRAARLKLADMSTDILIQASFLPSSPPADPADRIIAATARALNCRLMTRDRKLLTYGEAGHMQTIAC